MTPQIVAIALAVALACTAFSCTSPRPQPPGGDLYRGVAEVLK